ARRAVDGARTANRRGDLRDRARSQPQRARELSPSRAEHERGPALRRLRIHSGDGTRGDGRGGFRARAERGREGVLSRAVDCGPEIVPGCEALPQAEALAGMIDPVRLLRRGFLASGARRRSVPHSLPRAPDATIKLKVAESPS